MYQFIFCSLLKWILNLSCQLTKNGDCSAATGAYPKKIDVLWKGFVILFFLYKLVSLQLACTIYSFNFFWEMVVLIFLSWALFSGKKPVIINNEVASGKETSITTVKSVWRGFSNKSRVSIFLPWTRK